MCGIFGLISSDKISPSLIEDFKSAGQSLNHRGPDGEGIFTSDDYIAIHKRLAIIDLEGGRQPIFNEDGRLCIVYNGEIYNYKQLRDELLTKGHRFKTNSDTEVIVHLFEEYGKECLHKLRGMFAFGIWDTQSKKLFAARDRLGIKPFYYCLTGGNFIYASEIKAILATGLVQAEADLLALREYLALKYPLESRTFFRNIVCLKPGHYIEWENGRLSDQRQYWDIEYHPESSDPDKIQQKFNEVFEDSIRHHLVSDVPVGTFLSGGLDSSAITWEASRQYNNGRLHTFTCGTEDEFKGDLYFAQLAAKECGTDHNEVLQTPKKFMEFISKCIWHLDEPGGGSTAIHGYYVAKAARQYVKVLLSGEGGDEIFGGYRHYLQAYFDRQGITSKLTMSPDYLHNIGFRHLLKNIYTQIFYHDLPKSSLLLRANFSPDETLRILNPDIFRATNGYNPWEIYFDIIKRKKNMPEETALQYADIKTYLYRILHIYDRMCMAVGLENRVPMLDHPLVEFAFSIPNSELYHGMQTKTLVRKYLNGKFSDAVVNRPKAGFTLPVGKWFRTDLRADVEDILFSRKAKDRGILNTREVERVWSSFLSRGLFQEKIWAMISIELWCRMFIDNDGPSF